MGGSFRLEPVAEILNANKIVTIGTTWVWNSRTSSKLNQAD
jgi:hypothetical protein